MIDTPFGCTQSVPTGKKMGNFQQNCRNATVCHAGGREFESRRPRLRKLVNYKSQAFLF